MSEPSFDLNAPAAWSSGGAKNLKQPGLSRLESVASALMQAAKVAGIELCFDEDCLPVTLVRLVGASDYCASVLQRDAAHWVRAASEELGWTRDFEAATLDDAAFDRIYGIGSPPADDREFRAWLRRMRHHELVRIAARDLSGAALNEVLSDLSRLARTSIELAARFASRRIESRFGVPQDKTGQPLGLVILGLGKLGGGELNFSSDIDLIFAYEREGTCHGERGESAAAEFFRRVGQLLISLLADTTADGFCYRVDMRLRPFGDAGPLVMTFDQMEDYYQTHGREWERYALIKATRVAGDPAAATRLKDRLRPFIYRRYLDYGAFANLRELKSKINDDSSRRGRREDVKFGEGGIREVEFVAQAFQLIRGGRDPALQRPDLLGVLEVLVARRLLPKFSADQLRETYIFLRRVENRLQMRDDQQVHHLPSEPEGRLRLALAMGFDSETSFETALIRHMRRAHAHFNQVFRAPQRDVDDGASRSQQTLEQIWSGDLGADETARKLAGLGFARPERAQRELMDLDDSPSVRALTSTGRIRLDRLMPLLIGAVGECDEPDVVLPRLTTLVRTVARRSVYLSLLVEHPLALSQLVRLCAASPWIAAELTRHPVLLDELLDPRSLYNPPDTEGLRAAIALELEAIDPDDVEALLDRLRTFRQAQSLRIAAADVVGALPVMRVSDQLTQLAEVVLEAVLRLAWRSVAVRHGVPRTLIDAPVGSGFAVVAYGKLGGYELGYGSDLDLVFLMDENLKGVPTTGSREVDSLEFYARVAQRIAHWMGAYTAAGRLYEVDTRLRPSGQAGLPVSPLDAFERYQDEAAWTWEHQALVRARYVTGDEQLGARFAELRKRILTRQRDTEALRREVGDMRARMRAEHSGKGQVVDLKRDPGGITDIEFMVQYWVLAHAPAHPDVTAHPDKVRALAALAAAGCVPAPTAERLTTAWLNLRNRLHQQTLAGSGAKVETSDSEIQDDLRAVRGIWSEVFGDAP